MIRGLRMWHVDLSFLVNWTGFSALSLYGVWTESEVAKIFITTGIVIYVGANSYIARQKILRENNVTP